MVTARKWVAAGFGGPEVLRNIEADVGIGVAAGLALLALSLRYEHHKLTPVVLSSYVV
jgi:hypothetical protein